jgi:hypothetical protein
VGDRGDVHPGDGAGDLRFTLRARPFDTIVPVSNRVQVIETTWPLLVVRFPRVVDAAAVSDMIGAFERALARGSRFASVLDGSQIERLPRAKERETLVAWMGDEAHQEKERALSVAAAVVATSGLLRAFVAAIYFVRKPHAPQKWTETALEGVDWACAQLVAAGVPLTPEIEKFRADLGHPGR